MTKSTLPISIWVTLIGLYVGQAIPLYLVAAAFPPILRARGVDLQMIGAFGILMAPWVFKFLWAPLLDKYRPPLLSGRKGWIITTQLVVLATIVTLSQFDPLEQVEYFFPVLLLMSFAAATQDIATDGYAVEHLTPEQQPIGNAIQGGAIAAGVLIGGSLTLFIYDIVGWEFSVLSVGALSALAILPVFFINEQTGRRSAPSETTAPKPSFKAFFARKETVAILGFALLFRVPEGLIKAVEQAFLVDLNFSLTQIGIISGGGAAVVGLVGSTLGMMLILGMGLGGFLWTIITLRTLCFAGYVLAAYQGLPLELLIGLSLLNTFSRYMEIVGLYTAFMRVASLNQAGTDFTILSSANVSMYMFGSLFAGWFGQHYGYISLFSLATFLSIVTGIWAMRLGRQVIDMGKETPSLNSQPAH
ncbi:MAG: MFS transporter [Parvibaculaceae bacterium]|nr:MFS transporter [Parvibaculaceae bacterium]